MGNIRKHSLPDTSKDQEPSIPSSPGSVPDRETRSAYKTGAIPHKQIIISAIAAVLVVVLALVIGINIGIGIKRAPKPTASALPRTRSEAYSAMEKVPDKPSNATDNAGFPAFKKSERNADAPTVELYNGLPLPVLRRRCPSSHPDS